MAPWPHLHAIPFILDMHTVALIMQLVRNKSFTLTTSTGKQSRLRYHKNGVPQGLVLAPLLFNIYTYDLPVKVARKFAYADDLAILDYEIDWQAFKGLLLRIWQLYLLPLQMKALKSVLENSEK